MENLHSDEKREHGGNFITINYNGKQWYKGTKILIKNSRHATH
jgi:hypothetical protein